eukprot:403374540
MAYNFQNNAGNQPPVYYQQPPSDHMQMEFQPQNEFQFENRENFNYGVEQPMPNQMLQNNANNLQQVPPNMTERQIRYSLYVPPEELQVQDQQYNFNNAMKVQGVPNISGGIQYDIFDPNMQPTQQVPGMQFQPQQQMPQPNQFTTQARLIQAPSLHFKPLTQVQAVPQKQEPQQSKTEETQKQKQDESAGYEQNSILNTEGRPSQVKRSKGAKASIAKNDALVADQKTCNCSIF